MNESPRVSVIVLFCLFVCLFVLCVCYVSMNRLNDLVLLD